MNSTFYKIKDIRTFLIENDDIAEKKFEISYDFDSDVEKLQKFLSSQGFYIGKFGKNKDGIDGKYGPFTKAAHVAFLGKVTPEDFKKNRVELAQNFIGDIDEKTLKNEFKFDRIPLGINNYRSAQIPVTIKGKDFLGPIIDKYGIKTIIRFNGDGKDSRHTSIHPQTSIEDERNLAKSKGIEFKKLSATRNQEEVNSELSKGNVLIHCAHGADRTGGNVGGWLYKNGWGDTKKIWDYSTKYNRWNRMVAYSPSEFVNGGFLTQAQKFGVKDLEHAKKLAGIKK